MAHDDRRSADDAIDHVEQLSDRNGGGALGVRALVVAGVGDDQSVRRGHQRVEQDLAVLGARVTVADVWVAEEEVVAVAGRVARKDGVVEAEQADDPMRDAAHRVQRAHRQMPGPEVRAGRAAGQADLEQRGDVGHVQGRGAWAVLAGGLVDDVGQQAVHLGALPAVARRQGRERVGGVGQRGRPGVDRPALSEVRDRCLKAVEILGEAPRKVDRGAVDIVVGDYAVQQPRLVLGHRDAGHQAIQTGLPRALRDVLQAEQNTVVRVEAPACTDRGDPLLQPAHVVLREAEASPDRLAVGEVEDLGGGDARGCELEQSRDNAEDGVGLAEGPVGEADAQVCGRAVRRIGVASVVGIARAEGRLDERRECLNVRAHDNDVARLERRVVLEGMQNRVAKNLHLAGRAVAGVDLKAGVRAHGGLRRWDSVVPDVGLHPCEQSPGVAVVRAAAVAVARHPGLARDHHLKLAPVAPPGGQKRVGRQERRADRGARDRRAVIAERIGDAVPRRGGRLKQEQVHFASAVGQRA
jgi:hypothetical protein